jgi:hypothetical protein
LLVGASALRVPLMIGSDCSSSLEGRLGKPYFFSTAHQTEDMTEFISVIEE